MRRILLIAFISFVLVSSSLAQEQEYERHQVVSGETANQIAVEYGTCPEAILEANHYDEYENYNVLPVNDILIVPITDEPCFEAYTIETGERIINVLQEHNVCINDYLFNSPQPTNYVTIPLGETHAPQEGTYTIWLRVDTPPCYENGLRRIFYDESGLLPEPIYVPAERKLVTEEDIASNQQPSSFIKSRHLSSIAYENGWCWDDIARINHPHMYYRLQVGDVYYVPQDVSHCDAYYPEGMSLAQASIEYNVCLEALMEYNGANRTWLYFSQDDENPYPDGLAAVRKTLIVPIDIAPCYNEQGSRIGYEDIAIHQTQPNEWLYEIALQYDVCVDDLLETNPLLNLKFLLRFSRLPSLIFIPDVFSCAERMGTDEMVHLGRIQSTYLPLIYNVCLEDIITANDIKLGGDSLSFGTTDAVIPQDRPPCFDRNRLAWDMKYRRLETHDIYQIPYVCYAQDIDFDADYTGHEPVISPVPFGTADSHCYEFDKLSHIVVENETLWFVSTYYATQAAECFGVSVSDVSLVTWENIVSTEWNYVPFWTTASPNSLCPLAVGDAEAQQLWNTQYWEHTFKNLGEIDTEGVYTVLHFDTLNTIGRKYGYFPWMIALANGLENPNYILPFQRLRMPPYPNMYLLAKIGAGLLLLVLLNSIFRRRTNRKMKEKVKNDNKVI